jgi:hypothetical protein
VRKALRALPHRLYRYVSSLTQNSARKVIVLLSPLLSILSANVSIIAQRWRLARIPVPQLPKPYNAEGVGPRGVISAGRIARGAASWITVLPIIVWSVKMIANRRYLGV